MFNENEKDQKTQIEVQDTQKGNDIFQIEEIKIEEMAIDGICGVY